jgi:alpha-N-arabinofuranosidase
MQRRVELATRIAGVSHVVRAVPIGAGAVTLEVEAHAQRYDFRFRTDDGGVTAVGSAPTQPLSSEKAGGFTGVFIGMYASGPAPMPPADFAWFEYEPLGD